MLWKRTGLTLLFLGMLATVHCGPGDLASGPAGPQQPGQPIGLTGVQQTFKQVSYRTNVGEVQSSHFVQVDVDYQQSTAPVFFNLVFGGRWVIRNYAIPALGGPGRLTFLIETETPDGTPMTSADTVWAYTEQPLNGAPTQDVPTSEIQARENESVGQTEISHFVGVRGLKLVLANPLESGFVGSSAPGEVVDSAVHQEFPNQEQAVSECSPASIANSLAFLNRTGGLGLASDSIDAEAMKPVTKFDPALAADGLPRGSRPLLETAPNKNELMATRGIKIQTDYADSRNDPGFMDRLLQAVKQGNDVEVEFIGHVTSVVGVIKLSDGTYNVLTADDLRQGQAGGGATLGYTATYENGTWFLKGTGPVKLAEGEGVIETQLRGSLIERLASTPPTPTETISPSPSPTASDSPSPTPKTDISGEFVSTYQQVDSGFLTFDFVQTPSSNLEIYGFEINKMDNPNFPFSEVTSLDSSVNDPNSNMIEHFQTSQSSDTLRWTRGLRLVLNEHAALDVKAQNGFTAAALGASQVVVVHVLGKQPDGAAIDSNLGVVPLTRTP